MRRVIYKKQYGPVERIAELAEEGGPTISAWGKEVLVSAAIEFSKKYRQGIEISEDGNELGVDLYLTDHFFMGEGKEQLTFLFQRQGGWIFPWDRRMFYLIFITKYYKRDGKMFPSLFIFLPCLSTILTFPWKRIALKKEGVILKIRI